MQNAYSKNLFFKTALNNITLKNDAKQVKISGYASVFNIVDCYNDVIVEGAFLQSIKQNGDNIKLLWQHKMDEPVGNITRILEDKTGLYIEGILYPELQRAKEAEILIRERVISSLSIGFAIENYFIDNNIRFIDKIDLFEVSLVTFPANKSTTVSLKQDESNYDNSYNRLIQIMDNIIRL